jgi:hypothetical protein
MDSGGKSQERLLLTQFGWIRQVASFTYRRIGVKIRLLKYGRRNHFSIDEAYTAKNKKKVMINV